MAANTAHLLLLINFFFFSCLVVSLLAGFLSAYGKGAGRPCILF